MKKVLVIEDNRDNLRLITYALQRNDYGMIAAETGEAGVELAIQERPYFIIVDVNLPGIDGLEVARRIRSLDIVKDTPIIAITSYAMVGDRERILEVGCNGYFEKPIDPLTIVEKIEEVLSEKKVER